MKNLLFILTITIFVISLMSCGSTSGNKDWEAKIAAQKHQNDTLRMKNVGLENDLKHLRDSMQVLAGKSCQDPDLHFMTASRFSADPNLKYKVLFVSENDVFTALNADDVSGKGLHGVQITCLLESIEVTPKLIIVDEPFFDADKKRTAPKFTSGQMISLLDFIVVVTVKYQHDLNPNAGTIDGNDEAGNLGKMGG